MTIIINPSTDAAFNLAAEEFVLERLTQGDYLMMWISSPSVVVGKFQNPYGEVSLAECAKSGVPVLRRNSGGGTVYHDRGNVNYTLTTDRRDADYSRFLAPVIASLALLGVEAHIEDTSAIFCGEYKISGNAQANTAARTMHHGTLLYDTDLTALHTLTGHANERIRSKGIRSKPSPVALIRPLSSRPDMTAWEFADFVAENTAKAYADDEEHRCFSRAFTREEIDEIEKIADAKYRTWEWNFGRSPAFVIETPCVKLEANRGIVTSLETAFDCPCAELVGKRLVPEEIFEISERLYKEIF